MKHLIDIESLTVDEINRICRVAQEFEKGIRKSNHLSAHAVNMFFENSTRTKLSFEMAQNKLNINKYDFSKDTSSLNKGEDIYDTINNLAAIGMDLFIIRHTDDNLIKELSKKTYYKDISFINAGSGVLAHPTQALLDFYTLKKQFVDLKGKVIVIVGDIKHSRVAKSNIALLKKFEAIIKCLAPNEFMDENKIEGVNYYTNLTEAFMDADIVMALRIQKERIEENFNLNFDIDEYIRNYQITKENLPYGAFLMHPGPINKNIEIKEDVLLTKNARTILEQAKNGVYIRMAVMDAILASKGL